MRDSELVLWNGGIWRWLDAPTAIRAVAELAARRPRLRLVFMGGAAEHPAAAQSTREARALAEQLGLLGSVVHFHDSWVAYAERGAWLLQADCAISAHAEHLETRFAYRTRLLDCFWARLPVVCTSGDDLADYVAARAPRRGRAAAGRATRSRRRWSRCSTTGATAMPQRLARRRRAPELAAHGRAARALDRRAARRTRGRETRRKRCARRSRSARAKPPTWRAGACCSTAADAKAPAQPPPAGARAAAQRRRAATARQAAASPGRERANSATRGRLTASSARPSTARWAREKCASAYCTMPWWIERMRSALLQRLKLPPPRWRKTAAGT